MICAYGSCVSESACNEMGLIFYKCDKNNSCPSLTGKFVFPLYDFITLPADKYS